MKPSKTQPSQAKVADPRKEAKQSAAGVGSGNWSNHKAGSLRSAAKLRKAGACDCNCCGY